MEIGTPPAPKVAIIVNSALRPHIQQSLDQYKINLEAEGWSVTIYSTSGGEPPDLRAHLRGIPGLVGAVLVGCLPVPWFELFCERSEELEQFPIDLYYMDLDGTWTDADGDRMYDEHSDPDGVGPKDKAPEIWVGRLTAGPLTGDEATLVTDYFTRNNKWRQGLLPTNERALVYVDDTWIPWAGKRSAEVGIAFPTRTLVKDSATTTASDFKDRLTHNYQWISLFVHSRANRHYFRIGDNWAAGGHVYPSDIQTIRPVAIFYNLYACSAARFVETDYIGGWYIFAGGHGLAVIGHTDVGSMLQFHYFYGPLAKEKTLGEAFKEWFIAIYPFCAFDRSRHYGMTLLGDPTLTITVTPTPPVGPITFPDSNLETAIREVLEIELKANIYRIHLERLAVFDASRRRISDLTGLEYAVNLTWLSLCSNQIANILPLSNLTNLTVLTLWGNRITDISPLSNLINLTWLSLGDNRITDISPLSALINLQELYLGWNQIRDISPLVANEGLSQTDHIDLRANPLNWRSRRIYLPRLKGRGVEVLYDR